jgi:hypothetical protein
MFTVAFGEDPKRDSIHAPEIHNFSFTSLFFNVSYSWSGGVEEIFLPIPTCVRHQIWRGISFMYNEDENGGIICS